MAVEFGCWRGNHILKNEAQKKPSTYRGLPVNYIILLTEVMI